MFYVEKRRDQKRNGWMKVIWEHCLCMRCLCGRSYQVEIKDIGGPFQIFGRLAKEKRTFTNS